MNEGFFHKMNCLPPFPQHRCRIKYNLFFIFFFLFNGYQYVGHRDFCILKTYRIYVEISELVASKE